MGRIPEPAPVHRGGPFSSGSESDNTQVLMNQEDGIRCAIRRVISPAGGPICQLFSRQPQSADITVAGWSDRLAQKG